MKKKLIIIMTMVALMVTQTMQVKSADRITKDPVVKQLEQQIKFPEQLKKESGKGMVCVSFTVDSTGQITVIDTNASDASVQSNVIEQLKLMTLNTEGIQPGVTYYVKINFRLIN